MIKTFFFLFGFGLMVLGFSYIIIYLNLFTMGYSFFDYIKYIFTHLECLYCLIGLIIDSIVIFTWRDKYDLCL